MAETLTYDAGTDTVTDGEGNNLTPAEQDSLAVGEEIVSQQEQLLAGKYKNAEELEKAYVELQSKLGENEKEDNTEAKEEEVLPEESEKDSKEYSEGAQLINDASAEYWENDGALKPETIEKFASLSSQDLVNAYLEVQKGATNEQQPSTPDLTENDINVVKNSVGGDAEYGKIVSWAKDNMSDKESAAFDDLVSTGNVGAISLAAQGLQAKYNDANGYEGRMLSGKSPKTSEDTIRSQAELVRAMSDPRYDDDPAYRQDVIAKLDRSDVQF